MIFIEAIGSAYSKYFQTSGRSSRSEWWFFVFFLFIVGKCLNLLSYSSFCDSNNCEVPIFLFSVIFVLATVIPFCALCIRRLHDIGLSGWWMNIAFTVIGIIPFFYWMCKKGDEDEKKTDDSDENKEQQQPAQLSKEDAQRLLDAQKNQEQKTQDKLKELKAKKGQKVKIEKDW